MGGFEGSGFAAEPVQLAAQVGVVWPQRLLAGVVGLGDGDGAGFFGLTGSASGPQPEVTVLGPEHVSFVGSYGLLESVAGVSDGGVDPAASPGVQVGSVGFELHDLVPDVCELVGDIWWDGPDQPVPFAS